MGQGDPGNEMRTQFRGDCLWYVPLLSGNDGIRSFYARKQHMENIGNRSELDSSAHLCTVNS